ncbi:MAG: hypothetical protein K9L68_13430, partial [Spirochaetales bacterium]|nr:hypothetical protein [Spirochaetales bacterium]MCF7939595.1 hypothetical protein [Spirochaetales bacterium]
MSDDGPDFGGSGIGDRGTCDTGRGGSGHGNPGPGGAGTGEAGLGGSGHGNPEPGGYPSIIGEGDQRNIFYRGKPLYPASDPAARARKRAENAALQENTLYLFPSPLLGYGTEILLKRLPAGSFLLLLECDRELDRLCGPSLQSLAEKTDRALYFFAPDNIQFEAMLSELELTRFRRVESISLSGGYRLFSETYRSFHRQAHEAIRRRWRNRMTLTHMGRLYVRNLLWNLPAYAVQASAGRNGGAEGSAGEGGAVAGRDGGAEGSAGEGGAVASRDGGAEGVGSGGACGSSAAASGVGGAGVGSGGACGSSAAASGVGGAEGAGGERPVVVFGAGESAEAAVRLLKESGLRESFTVMAVDTAL